MLRRLALNLAASIHQARERLILLQQQAILDHSLIVRGEAVKRGVVRLQLQCARHRFVVIDRRALRILLGEKYHLVPGDGRRKLVIRDGSVREAGSSKPSNLGTRPASPFSAGVMRSTGSAHYPGCVKSCSTTGATLTRTDSRSSAVCAAVGRTRTRCRWTATPC